MKTEQHESGGRKPKDRDNHESDAVREMADELAEAYDDVELDEIEPPKELLERVRGDKELPDTKAKRPKPDEEEGTS
jgi:hypothetical protein